MPYAPEPPYSHGQARPGAPIAVVLCNLGTPEAPTASALRTYLAEFLGDPRVVEIPRPLWWLILHGVILRVRPAKSARKYASVWLPEGSPLKVWTDKQTSLLRGYLGERGHRISVRLRDALRLAIDRIGARPAAGRRRAADPGVADVSAIFGDDHRQRLRRGLPLGRQDPPPARVPLRQPLPRHPGYIAAIARRITASLGPARTARQAGDEFSRAAAAQPDARRPVSLRMPEDRPAGRRATGPDRRRSGGDVPEPIRQGQMAAAVYRADADRAGRSGVKRVDILCPGFVADCLETLEEIAIEARDAFLGAGGETFHYICRA